MAKGKGLREVGYIDCSGGGQVVVKNDVAYIGNMSAPDGTLVVDVSDPRKPKELARLGMFVGTHSHKVRVENDIMVINRERNPFQAGAPADFKGGLGIYDVSKRGRPKFITNWETDGRGVHRFDFDGRYAYISPTVKGYVGNIVVILDLVNPAKPVEVGRWWMPGTMKGDAAAPPPRHALDKGYRAHNTNVYKQRPDRMYLCYIDGGMFVMDIADKSKPKMVSHWTNSPPYTGFMHTALPLFDRGLLIVTDESTENSAKDWPKLVWILDLRDEKNPVSIATCPMPPLDAYKDRGGRFGAHNLHENAPVPTAWQSDQILLGTFFNGGLRAYDISNAYQPKEIAAFVPPAPKGTPAGAVQLNDVFVDERQIVYTMDRFTGGLYTLEMDF